MYKNEIEFAKNLALAAGKIIKNNFSLSYSAEFKEDQSPVTVIDKKVNKLVIEEVAKVFPTHTVLGEEESNNLNSDYAWICDPIDGTIPFTMGLPVSVFGLALLKNGIPIIGVIYDPYMDRLYYAAKESGAYLNGQEIKVNNLKLSPKARINLDWWPQAEYNIYEPVINLVKKTGAYMFSPGSTIQAGAMLARGEFTASIFAGSKGKFVDVAPQKIIIEEAGGKVTDLFGNDQRYDQDIKGAVISNGIVHQEIIDEIRKYF